MGKTRVRLSEQVRRAVDESGVSRYALCKAAGIDEGSFSRFMAGKVGLSLASLDALAAVLRLRIVAEGRPDVPPAGKPGRPRKEGR